ncbi:hypothetical protein D3C84_877790 [compost metagenome]
MCGHPTGTQRYGHQAMHQAWDLPEHRYDGTHHQGVEYTGEEVTGGRAVDTAELTGKQLVETKTQRGTEWQQHGWGEQRTARMDDHRHPNKTDQYRHPLTTGHFLPQQRQRQRRHQQRRKEVDRRRLGQRNILQGRGEQQAGSQQTECAQRLQSWPTSAQYA